MNKNILKTIVLLIGIAGIAYFYYNRYRIAPAKLFSEIEVQSLDGKEFDTSTFEGENTIVVFFATWCIDCRRELPEIQNLSGLASELGINVLLVSDEALSTLNDFKNNVKSPLQLVKLKGSFKENGIYTLPTTYMYCKDGSLFKKQTNALHWTDGLLRSYSAACK